MKNSVIWSSVFMAFALVRVFGQETVPARLLTGVPVLNQAAGIRNALTGVLDQASHERRILSGTITRGESRTPFTFTRELDQKVRLDLSEASGGISLKTVGLNLASLPQGSTAGGTAESQHYDILEVLTEDTPEALLYSFGSPTQVRWLGDHYRSDDGKDPDYVGPLYDVYVSIGKSGVQPGLPPRNKVFLFDTKTQLLSQTRYEIQKDGAAIQVVVFFNAWKSLGGQMVPSTIERRENDQTVFLISINSASSLGAQIDSLSNN